MLKRLLCATAFLTCSAEQVRAQDDAPCLTDEHEQVAFLTGDWTVVSRQRTSMSSDDWIETEAEARWRPVLGGCVMEESWSGVVGDTYLEWIQLIAFNSRDATWERSFVDTAHGNLLMSEGHIDDGVLIFNASQIRNGRLLIDRTTFEPVDGDDFQVRVESSFDGGKEWTIFWEMDYTRR